MNKWKVVAIIFIVLFTLESIGVVYLMKIGLETIDNENTCSYNICENYETYYYDEWEEVCYCFVGDDIGHQEYMG